MVRPKKHLGQHFLRDRNIAGKITASLTGHLNYKRVLEVGPGTGVLTEFLIHDYPDRLTLIDLDRESVDYLKEHYPGLRDQIIYGDFLKIELDKLMKENFALIGNFPYNISSQIFFRVLDHRDMIPEVVGMIQKEVADRLVSPPGNKQYGILSVLLQAWYDLEYLFTVEPGVFHPPPKVRSAVIRLQRNEKKVLGCDEELFTRVVKQGFQNRRKTLRNALKPLNLPAAETGHSIFGQRAEQLSVDNFVELTNLISSWSR